MTASNRFLEKTTQKLSSLGKSRSVPLEPGDLFLSIAASVGIPIISKIKCCIHDGFVYFPGLSEDSNYVYYLFLTGQPFSGLGKLGTQLNLNTDTVGDIFIPKPSRPEQRAIAAFLNQETSKIDRLIEKMNRLIELVEEKRSALIHEVSQQAGTRDFRLEVVTEVINRPIDRLDDEIYRPIGLLNRGRGIFHKPDTLGADLGDSDFFWVEDGDLVLSGQFAWEGAVALAGRDDARCVATHRYPILRGKPEIVDTAYLLALLRTKTGHFLLNEHSRGSAGRNRPLNAGTLLKEKFPIPLVGAQRRVSALVHSEKQISGAISQLIERLLEYRQALITAVVTGKIDVRNEVEVDA